MARLTCMLTSETLPTATCTERALPDWAPGAK